MIKTIQTKTNTANEKCCYERSSGSRRDLMSSGYSLSRYHNSYCDGEALDFDQVYECS